MSEESEEACLVNPRSPSFCGFPSGLMPYTDGVQSVVSQYTTQMNSVGSPAAGSVLAGERQGDANEATSKVDRSTGAGTESSGRGSQSHESESGELIEYNNDLLLSQFHADAIKQTGCGKFQILTALIVGLGLAGHTIQVYAVFYILPSAELEFCILVNEKSWLGCITLLGVGCGALLWGGLAGRTGRRKTLLSCLVVSEIFSIVAAFMPTYDLFMMTRFCAAAGIGGALPAGASYLCEMSPGYARTRLLSLLGTLGVAGAVFAGGIAIITVPQTGQEIMMESKEHFSAWHRYLLIISLPTVASILGLFWLPESPRWLLDVGREVDALAIYQKIYKSNRARGGYTLTELELPGTRGHKHHIPSSVLAGMAHGIHMFFNSFLQLFRKNYSKTTTLLIASWFIAMFVYHGLTLFIAGYSRTIEQERYNQQTVVKVHKSYDNVMFNNSMENLVFSQSAFVNCTFRRVFLSHVHFDNCSFIDTEFTNVKTSRTTFSNCVLDNVKLIDTDLTERHFINCSKNNTEQIRLPRNCDREFDHNIFLEALWRSNLGALIPGVLSVAFIGEAIHRFGRSRIATTCFSFATMLCCALGFMFIDEHVIWTGGTAQGLILAGLTALTVLTIETYTTSLRCTALGMCVCAGHLGALVSTPIFASMSINVAAGLSTLSMIIPVISSGTLKDPCFLL